jgi:hypothetical protein
MDIVAGTIQWKWQDKTGLEHAFKIPNSFFIRSGQAASLARRAGRNPPKNEKAWKQADSRNCTLYWQDGKHNLALPLGMQENVATLQLSLSYTKYDAFCTEAKIPDEYDHNPIIAI